jgi:hypothetical protein
MHLTPSEYNGSTAKPGSAQGQRFFSWIRDRMNTGGRVMLGVYIKGSQDREYDHIVPAIDVVTSGLKDGGRRVLQDRLFFADNYGHIQSGTFRDLRRNRLQANVSSAPPYSIPAGVGNYALAIRGIADPDRVTIPVILQASRNNEPVLLDGALQPPTPEPLAIRATVLIPDQNQSYNVYRYDDFRQVPEASFNAAAERFSVLVDFRAFRGICFLRYRCFNERYRRVSRCTDNCSLSGHRDSIFRRLFAPHTSASTFASCSALTTRPLSSKPSI